MTVTMQQLALYAAAMAGLWAVPGPVWVALTARARSGGMRGAWVLSVYGDALHVLRRIAAGVFVGMGLLLIRAPARTLDSDSRMTRPGIWAGFSVGVAAVIGNPKAILFYMGFLPGFFDLSQITMSDIAAILAVSTIVPMVGNLALALFLDRARRLLQNPEAIRRLNVGSGLLLILVGLVIPFA